MKILCVFWRARPVARVMAAGAGVLVAPGTGWAALGQEGGGMAPLPAEPPIGGPVWTVLIPAVLLIGSFLATFLLYRRFSREGGE